MEWGLQSKVLARRVSSRPMDAHFWKKHKENSPNLLYVLEKHAFWTASFQCLAKSLLQSWTNLNVPFIFLPGSKNECSVLFFRNGMNTWKNLSGAKRCLQKLRIIYRANLSFYLGRTQCMMLLQDTYFRWLILIQASLTQQHHSCELKLTLNLIQQGQPCGTLFLLFLLFR